MNYTVQPPAQGSCDGPDYMISYISKKGSVNWNQIFMMIFEFQTLLSLMLPHHKKLKDQINEVLDMELIKQEISHGCFDMDECTKFIIVIMGKLCAPLRDEKLKELKNHTGIASTLRLVTSVGF